MWPPLELLKQHADVVLATGAVVGGGWRYVVIPARAYLRRRAANIAGYRSKQDRIHDFVEQSAPRIALIQKELFPNGGASLRDTIDHVALDLREIRRAHVVTGDFVKALACEAGVIIQQFDANGDLLWATDRWHQLTGLSIEQAGGWGWVNALHIEDRDRVEDKWNDALRHCRPFIDAFRFRNVKTGDVIEVRVEAYPSEITLGTDKAAAGWVAQMRVAPAAA